MHGFVVNPLQCKGSYSATSNNMKLVHWPLMGGLLHLVQRGGDWGVRLAQFPSRCTNVTAHPSTTSVPMTVSLHNGPVLCGFNVTIKGLKCSQTVGSRDGPWLCPGLAGEANYDNVCISVHIKIEVSYRIMKYNIHIFRTGMNDFSMYFTVHWQTVVCMS